MMTEFNSQLKLECFKMVLEIDKKKSLETLMKEANDLYDWLITQS